jgi:hypothetical protein
MTRAEPRGPNWWGSGHCPGCGWTFELHPLDMDGVDACRCPVQSEQDQIVQMLDKHKRELLVLAHTFPESRP